MTNESFYDQGYLGLFAAELTDIFPDDSTDIQCLSYSLKKAMQMVRRYSERLVLKNNLDNLPDSILDYLAIERAVPFYDTSFNSSVKRQLIRDSYQSFWNRGTTGMVENLIQSIFSSGEIKEWFDFLPGEQTPGLFDIEIGAEYVSENALETFGRILKDAKNMSRHLRKIGENHDTMIPSPVAFRTFLSDSIHIK